jgi:hypothetical protein
MSLALPCLTQGRAALSPAQERHRQHEQRGSALDGGNWLRILAPDFLQGQVAQPLRIALTRLGERDKLVRSKGTRPIGKAEYGPCRLCTQIEDSREERDVIRAF